ncbi:hypothetical protein NDU88_007201 [Pleurodeles waltl]|uniref:Uncharacterized protein n=1 Tax=Pleurodeles waltl TaxID=8319 RepID=A0AAV7SRU7_PLEWA|nr:hypothetical protein NDU88_007201 [Pleurodeles waltl]
MAGMGRLCSGTGAGRSQDTAVQDSQKLDAVLAAVECIGDSLERARTSLEAKIDKVTSDLILLHADHRKLADKTGAIEARVDDLMPMTSRLKSEMGDVLRLPGNSPSPRQLFLRLAYSCFRRSLRLTGRVVPFTPALALLGTPRGPKIMSGSELHA